MTMSKFLLGISSAIARNRSFLYLHANGTGTPLKIKKQINLQVSFYWNQIHVAQLVVNLTRDSGGLNLDSSLFSHPVIFGAPTNP